MAINPEESIELRTFFCTVSQEGEFEVTESRAVDDGGVMHPSPLTGYGQSVYSALAKLCFLNLEIQGRKSEIMYLCKYYMKLYDKGS